MKWSMLSLAAAVILLLLADVVAFHDLFEPHTVRDWLMLAGSALAIVALAAGSEGLLRHRRPAWLTGRPTPRH